MTLLPPPRDRNAPPAETHTRHPLDAHQPDAHQPDAHQPDAHQPDAHQPDAHQETLPPSSLPSRPGLLLLSGLMIFMGCMLALWTLTSMGSVWGASRPESVQSSTTVFASTATSTTLQQPAPAAQKSSMVVSTQPLAGNVAATAASALPVGLTVGVAEPVPDTFRTKLASIVLPGNLAVAIANNDAQQQPIYFDWQPAGGVPIYTATFAAAVRFDTIFPETTWQTIRSAWAGDVSTYTRVSVLKTTIPALEQILGRAGPTVASSATMSDVVAAAWSKDTPTLALVPFDHLVPSLAVLSVDGQTPVENAVKFNPAAYPLRAILHAHTTAPSRSEQPLIDALLASLPRENREPGRLTTLTMTGVTAMVRFMAREMDTRGAAWPAEYVGEELSSADITHISNEVPFTEDCKTDVRLDNFNFCTKTEYLETLRLSGVDIIGLTGNHQNDFGKKAALYSLDLYKREGLPVYGGGRNIEEATRPLYIEHNGNRLAFLGANSYGPRMAWAEGDYPGSARFDLNILSAMIRSIKEKELADVVLVELQYQESYDTMPLIDQRNDFNALTRAGADIVTGVQSHVPQGMEFTDGKLILYGLGNLYFDQMGSMATRENLIVKHTFYNGRHISTQIETTLLHDYGQPRWTTPAQREALLNRVFEHSYWEH